MQTAAEITKAKFEAMSTEALLKFFLRTAYGAEASIAASVLADREEAGDEHLTSVLNA